MLTIAAISVTAIVASQERVLVAVDVVGDGRADGNRYEDEEPREAAYRPRPRHPRDDGGRTPRTKRFILTGAADLPSFSGSREIETADYSRAATSRFRQSALRLAHDDVRIVSWPVRSLRNRRQGYVGYIASDGHHRGVSRAITVGSLNIVYRFFLVGPRRGIDEPTVIRLVPNEIDLELCPSHEISLGILYERL